MAKPYYGKGDKCAHPLDPVTVSTIAHMWPLRKTKADGDDTESSNMLSKCMMNFMRMAQSTKAQDDCKIDIYPDRVPMKSALARGASSRFDIVARAEEDDVRIDATTPDTKSEAIAPVKDAPADDLVEKAKAMLLSLTTMPHNDKVVDALVPLKKPMITMCDPAVKVKDEETGFTSASLLKALLDRDEQKKKDQAQKRREKEKKKAAC